MVKLPKLKWINKPLLFKGILTFALYDADDNIIYISQSYGLKRKLYAFQHEFLHYIFFQLSYIPEYILNKLIDWLDKKLWLRERRYYQDIDEIIMKSLS